MNAEREKFDSYYVHLPKFERDRMWRLYEEEKIESDRLLYEAALRSGVSIPFSMGGGGSNLNTPVISDNTIYILFDDLSNAPVSDVYSVEEWQLFFDPDSSNVGRIVSSTVNVSENSVTLGTTGTLDYTSVDNNFSGYLSLIRFIDTGYIQYIAESFFSGCENLVWVELNSVGRIRDYAFSECISLSTCILPSIQTIGNFGFDKCQSLTEIVYPTLTSIGIASFARCLISNRIILENLTECGVSSFSECVSALEIYLPACTDLGGSVGYDLVFNSCGSVAVATFNSVIETCDAGNPDGDVIVLQTNSPGVSISYV